MTAHRFACRVYYEDTDMAGIVYYANYLKFIERGRSEHVRTLGIDQAAMRDGAGLVFAVRRVEADYLHPARYGDDLIVETAIAAISGARLTYRQEVLRDGTPLFRALVQVICMTEAGRPVRFPADIRRKFTGNPG
ncbi:MAG: tol-pal system-associated acyl-CoA thioesterase [Rhodobacteraceae bacterium]|nr:tol-pal system-associated acyl-CoA thioesterase [Paracoccaceae bacterium]